MLLFFQACHTLGSSGGEPPAGLSYKLVPSSPLGAQFFEGGLGFLMDFTKCSCHNNEVKPSCIFSSRGQGFNPLLARLVNIKSS